MRRWLVLLILSLCLSACQALAIAPTPVLLAISHPVTAAPRPTWPPTWTPTSTWTPTATQTPQPTTGARFTATPTPIEFERQNWTAALKVTATRTPVRTSSPVTATRVPPTPVVDLRVFAIGDSVMLGAARELQKTISGIEVDAAVSRQVGATLAILQQRKAAGRLGKVVVLHIGDNGYVTAKQFDDLMQPLVDLPRVIVVNLKVPRKWEAANNQVLADGVTRYPNTVLVDWYTYGMDHPELFAKDGIHIGAAGAKAYTALVVAQLNGLPADPVARPTDNP